MGGRKTDFIHPPMPLRHHYEYLDFEWEGRGGGHTIKLTETVINSKMFHIDFLNIVDVLNNASVLVLLRATWVTGCK